MTFRRNVRLDGSQVRDLRGQGVSGRGLALAGGGGGLGILMFIVLAVLGGDPGGQRLPSDGGAGEHHRRRRLPDCRTGADANERLDCRIVGYANSIQSGPGSHAVATELQADCYAGVWAAHAADTGFLQLPSRDEIAIALDAAAAAVGDDRVQRRTTGVGPGGVDPRLEPPAPALVLVGYRGGDPTECRPSG